MYDNFLLEIFVNLPSNLVKATAGAINTAVNPLITAYEVATNKDVGINDVADQWKSNAKAGANMIKSDRNVINNLSTGKADVNDIQKATGNDKVKVYYDENDKVQGFHDNDTNDIYLNAANNTAINTDTFVRTYGHETAHDYTENESVANNAGSYAKGIFNTLNTLSFDSVNTSENATSKDWLGNQFSNVNSANALANNTIKAGGVVNRSNFRNENGVTVKDMLNSDEIKDEMKNKVKTGSLAFDSESKGNYNAINCKSDISCAKIINKDPAGGVSYGVGQIASLTDGMEKFANYLEENANFLNEKDGYNKNMYEEFLKAGGVEGAKAGTEEFRNFWKEASQYSDFAEHQTNFLYENNYKNDTVKTFEKYNIDVENLSTGAKALAWSAGIQYGEYMDKFLKIVTKNDDISTNSSEEFKQSITESRKKYVEQMMPSYIKGKDKNNSQEIQNYRKGIMFDRYQDEYKKSIILDRDSHENTY